MSPIVATRRGAAAACGSADRVLFVADTQAVPDADADRLISDVRRLHRAADLLLLNPAGAVEAEGGTRWIGRFSPEQIFHARRGHPKDLARIARLTTGRAIGLVLSGGGARGFAHIGAIRAFETAGVPIDIIGGTSMGALVGSGVGVGVDWAEIGRRLRHGFVDNNPVNDYTLPLVSLVRGRKMARLLRERLRRDHARESAGAPSSACLRTCRPAGSSFISRDRCGRPCVRRRRSPASLPPFILNNEILVDGGIMNNFPADVMSALARGPVWVWK